MVGLNLTELLPSKRKRQQISLFQLSTGKRPCEDTVRKGHLQTKEEPETSPDCTLISDFEPPFYDQIISVV